mmetsp:Transcript_44255/g.112094  ORF Transcript_44255/g.112094 Transcript_44255/m.112094 type:complete len:236 (+) Transcript_44255:397-1104(+)
MTSTSKTTRSCQRRWMMCIQPSAVTTGISTSPTSSLISWRKIGLKITLVVSLFVVITFILERYAEQSVSKVSKSIMEGIGLPGLFIFVFLADLMPQPFTYVPLIFIAVKGNVAKQLVFTTCASASYLAALTGYGIGAHLRKLSCGDQFFIKVREEFPFIPDLMQRQGATGVALAALLPVPLAFATWTAGSFSVDFKKFMVAAMCRWPKIMVFVLLSPPPAMKVAVHPDSVVKLIS